MEKSNTIRTYYLLTKPGIIMGNLITTVSGFALASRGNFDLWLFFFTMVGLGSVIASACVFNNYIDRVSDQKMARTRNRALVKGLISPQAAIVFAIGLGIFGFAFLAAFTNAIAVWVAAAGFFIYVAMYSFWKYQTGYATLIGSIAGAIPPVVGYCAVSGSFDLGSALLFMILVLWQMPHFFSIAMFRLKDYQTAAIPVMPVTRGAYATKVHMLLYILAFTVACMSLSWFGLTGRVSLITSAGLGLSWIYLAIQGFKSKNDPLWARKMFQLSLVIIILLCIVISVS